MTTKSTRSMSANIKMEVETEFVTWTGLTGVAQQGMDSEGDERSDWYVVVTEDADGRAVIARTWEVILNDDMVMSFEEIRRPRAQP